MFTQRLAGHSVATIARTLNDNHVPCPSGVDPHRNPHRTGDRWTTRTVATILNNPRYTGRQVWNRQYTDHTGSSRNPKLRRNPAQNWIISTRIAHPALVSEQDFVIAQNINAIATPEDGTTRTYLLTGLLRCRTCHRRMESHWVHGRPGYRCRHGHTSVTPTPPGHPRYLYRREDHILTQISEQLYTSGEDEKTVGVTSSTEPHETVEYLRKHHLMIICDAKTCEVTTG